MKHKIKNWQYELKKNKKKIFGALFFLAIVLVIYGLTGDYVNDKGGSATTDIILDHVDPYNLSFIFIWLFIVVVAVFILYPFFYKPQDFHYAITMFGLFILTRSIFITFTHLALPIDAVSDRFPGILQLLNFSNGLFFSGHTGLPFLGFLIFKKPKFLKYFFLASSLILGATVLLMHVHYSIDVFSAFFITYGIYTLGNKMFRRR